VSSLAKPEEPRDGIEALRARMGGLESALGDRRAGLTQAQSELATFRVRYRQDVGLLHEELDELERAIAEAELGEIAKRLEEERGGADAPSADSRPDPSPRFTSDAVRQLFREVAKTIHPDLAQDALARDRRHTLMVEANRAYALGDEDRLRWILQAWETSPEAVQDSDPDAARLRLLRRISQIEDELDLCARELAALQESPLWKLKVMVDEAAGQGKDLVADMVRRLKRDIMAARNRLDAMLWNP
jgi:hypothetical protein